MRVLKFRALIFLSALYLGLVALLYHFLWRKRTFEKLFELPGHDTDSNEYDYTINGTGTDKEFVQFNFKRQNGPHLLPQLVGDRALGRKGGTEGFQHSGSRLSNPILASPKLSQESFPPINASNLTASRPGSLGTPAPNYCLHAFYYMWYANTAVDGQYLHWNHRYLPHWDAKVTKKYPDGHHKPPGDIGANFYPKLGCYSSRNPVTMNTHMVQLRKAGVGVIAVSWYPPGTADDEGVPPDPLMSQLLDIAQKYAIKVAFHIEPYRNRTPSSIREDLKYINKHYSSHPAIYKLQRKWQEEKGDLRKLLVVYIYDSYLSPAQEWGEVFKVNGRLSVRGSEFDCIAISLLVERKHTQFITKGGFDGFYTYFASDGFSYGSSTKNWRTLATFAAENQILFIPSFGPGYEDTRVRPWNSRNSKARRDGDYYRDMFESALRLNHGGLLSVTSFNEWHEGTQIEAAVPKSSGGYTYLDYSPHSPDYYLDITKSFSHQLECTLGELLL